ncbi:hypothetical protein NUW54_g13556 [Trametes sanguinea]|uniref:Uncharacterized protein n=1 Tax=Trametes sanguinea TaxID=158606 RepID=A0ACC1MKQ1_9APHY|nr:hypothetical protein NUW54_g13556 [Trametes sanguinea]
MNGKDTHVRGLKVLGPLEPKLKEHEEPFPFETPQFKMYECIRIFDLTTCWLTRVYVPQWTNCWQAYMYRWQVVCSSSRVAAARATDAIQIHARVCGRVLTSFIILGIRTQRRPRPLSLGTVPGRQVFRSNAAMSDAEAGPSSAAHEIRITTHGKITNWVSFALEHFKVQVRRQTAGAAHAAIAQGQGSRKGGCDRGADEESRTEGATAATPTEKKQKKEGLPSSMATIPRLVSVVEIIKREYLKGLDARLAEQGSLSGLHQYNEIGDLVEAGYAEGNGDGEQGRTESLAQALQGKNQ